MSYQTKLFINNEYVSSKSGETLEVRNPNDDSVVVSDVQVAGAEDVDAAVAAATAAFKGEWSKYSGGQRAKCMLKFADLLDEKTSELAKLETIARASLSAFLQGYCDKLGGEMFPENGDNIYKLVRYEPLGVCAGLAAWNATYVYTGSKIAPAVAAGNTFIFKSSEKSPLGAITLGELVKEAGFPPGVINFVSGGGKTGQLLAAHMKIAKISFTGSVATGRKVQDAATKSNLKRVTLELGGKSPSLIFNDANIENALAQNSQGFLLNSGQVCAAGSRVLVQEKIAPEFIKALKGRFEQFSHAMGDTMSPNTFLGPMADKVQYDRVMAMLEQGKKDGAEMITGGTRKGNKGHFIEPTIFLNPSSSSTIYKDEIFGPVMSIKTFKTEEEGIELANDTSYGLSATLYTSDITRALRVSAKLESGTISINSSHSPTPQTPFGGMKQSGIGREVGKAGLMAYLEPKTIHINMNMPSAD